MRKRQPDVRLHKTFAPTVYGDWLTRRSTDQVSNLVLLKSTALLPGVAGLTRIIRVENDTEVLAESRHDHNLPTYKPLGHAAVNKNMESDARFLARKHRVQPGQIISDFASASNMRAQGTRVFLQNTRVRPEYVPLFFQTAQALTEATIDPASEAQSDYRAYIDTDIDSQDANYKHVKVFGVGNGNPAAGGAAQGAWQPFHNLYPEAILAFDHEYARGELAAGYAAGQLVITQATGVELQPIMPLRPVL